jgi:hypothetical protein
MTVNRQDKKDCAHCMVIRYFLYAVIPIMIMFMTGTELEGLRGIMLTDLAAWIFGIGFILMVAWKAWNEFWR